MIDKSVKIFSFIFLVLFVECNQPREVVMSHEPDSLKFGGEEFNQHVRPTEARTPEEEKSGFKLPEGFEIELFASEPDIGKPINISFDAKGRMWVTQSFEYPFAAAPGKGSDRITVLEDTNNDGRADKFTHFNDTLNIPIGIIPNENGAIAYSIPYVYAFADHNNDGKADDRKILFGPFEYKDTHGMVNNMVKGYDGWIHACHGFTNTSKVSGTDGDSILMISGNTFRFRPDGSRVEHTTHGRINPFGLAYDELGYLYSTDCHTSPLYQLIRGGDYTQWGKEEGMGFAPDMKPLEDEATALSGIAYYADKHFPKEYQSNFYIGDVVACRVYRNSFRFNGSSPEGKKEEDFVLSEDPWFRPVDVKLGPDGALYIADFYNSIIGHYEVPLDHPKRDRIRGRIWRITYKGSHNKNVDWNTASVEALIAALDADNLHIRLTAADQLVERIGQPSAVTIKGIYNEKELSTRKYVHGLWVLHRLNALQDDMIQKALYQTDPLIRLHTLRILLEQEDQSNLHFSLAKNSLQDKDPHVRRAALEILVKYPTLNSLENALAVRKDIPDYDSHLVYTARLIIRNLLRNDGLIQQVVKREWNQEDSKYLADVMLGVHSTEAGIFLARYIQNNPPEKEGMLRRYQHVARFVPSSQLEGVVRGAKQQQGNNINDIDLEFLKFRGIRQGIEQRGIRENAQLKVWGKELAEKLLKKYPLGHADESEEVRSRQIFAIELVGNYKLDKLEPQLKAFLNEDKLEHHHLKTAALNSLLKIAPDKNAELAKRILKNDTSPEELKIQIVRVLGDYPGHIVNSVLAEVNNPSPELQKAIVMSLSNSQEGLNMLFQKVRKGELLPRNLFEHEVEERIAINANASIQKEFEELTANLEPVQKEKEMLIFTRMEEFYSQKNAPSIANGQQIFVKNCTSCHKIGDMGGSIGPQLDGIGKWGPRALAEKVIDPNRNISENFRTYTIKMKDGKVMTGLYRRDEGEVKIFADVSGNEFSVPKNQIAEQKASKYTLMPEHFGNILSGKEFNDLLSYLLSLKSSRQ